jgi:hypothetical protein
MIFVMCFYSLPLFTNFDIFYANSVGSNYLQINYEEPFCPAQAQVSIIENIKIRTHTGK